MTVRELLLQRQGLVFIPPGSSAGSSAGLGAGSAPQPLRLGQAVELQVAELGFALSHRLSERLRTLPLAELTSTQDFLFRTLASMLGADRKHKPLFRKFPEGIPEDTGELYFKKLLIYFLQAPGQPCLSCGRIGTTHVLSPCRHVVCESCFDGASYSACPACEHHVDPGSPFFKPSPEPKAAAQPVRFKLLDLGTDLDQAARGFFVQLCQRAQAMSPSDRDALVTLVNEYKNQVLAWIPAEIPVKENRALIFGTLLKLCEIEQILPHARHQLATATDVLRLVAVYSGSDAALQGEAIMKQIPKEGRPSWLAAFANRLAQRLRKNPFFLQRMSAVPMTVRRFKVAKLSRGLRRFLLTILEGLSFPSLVEDLLRHRPYWIAVGEFLHPFEYARRFPNTALAFCVLRGTPLGNDALGQTLRQAPGLSALEPRADGRYVYRSYAARLELAAMARDGAHFTRILSERPGELARRLDHALRLAQASGQPPDQLIGQVVETFFQRTRLYKTPVLLTLRSLLPRRTKPAPVRIFWPKGLVAKGVSSADARRAIPPTATAAIERASTAELLRRFAEKPAFATAIVDTSLRTVVVPFNERTASRAAVALPRGSSIALPKSLDQGQLLRLFLHWCEPPANSATGEDNSTDIDLSVGFFDSAWGYVGVCSYYGLRFNDDKGSDLALSSGDLRDAPFPDGATEFIDLHVERAREAGIRYAVMVVNAYSGLPFSQLERSFAGLMLRKHDAGPHFDPRLVELKFDLQGINGIYLPMLIDLQENRLHWLDVYNKGDFALNNVATSRNAIQKLCPELLGYFASGVRPSMFELALLHAAARCPTVWLRGEGAQRFTRRPDEDLAAFHQRLLKGAADESLPALPSVENWASPEQPVFAALLRGDLELPAQSSCYALFRERQTATIAASELLS